MGQAVTTGICGRRGEERGWGRDRGGGQDPDFATFEGSGLDDI